MSQSDCGNTFTCGGVYAMYVAFDIPLDCQAEKRTAENS